MFGGAYYGSAYGGGQAAGGEEPPVAVPKLETLTDNFNDNTIDGSKWADVTDGGATIAEQNQRLELAIPSVALDGDNAALVSQNIYTLEDSYFVVKVLEVPNAATAAEAALTFKFTPDAQNAIRFVLTGGILNFWYQVDNIRSTIGALPFNTETMVYWRIREDAGVLYFETSQDGLDFTTHATWAWGGTFADLEGNAVIEFFVYQDETDPGNFFVDDFNLLPDTRTAPDVNFEGEGTMDVLPPFVNTAVNKPLPRTYEYKVFDNEGNYLGSWPDVISEFGYNHEINTAGSAIQVTLGRSIDTPFNDPVRLLTEAEEHILTEAGEFLQGDYFSPNRVGPGTDVAVNNRIEIWEYYGSIDNLLANPDLEEIITTGGDNIAVHYGAPNGRRVFKGRIVEWEADYGTSDNVLVTIATNGRQLDNYVLKNGETTTVPYLSQDPAAMLRSGINNLRAQGSTINFTPQSIQDTGNVASYTFRLNTGLELANKSIELAPSDWFWYLDIAEDDVYLLPRATTVAHRFVLGQHIVKAKFRESIIGIKNLYYFVGGDKNNDPDSPDYLYKKYLNQPSIDAYDQGLVRKTDQRVTNDNSASLIANSAIDADKNPRYAGSIDITSATYPIETVRLGDLIGFANFGNLIDGLTLIVAGLRYSADILSIKLEVLPPRVNKRIEDIRRNLNTQEQLNTPDTPS